MHLFSSLSHLMRGKKLLFFTPDVPESLWKLCKSFLFKQIKMQVETLIGIFAKKNVLKTQTFSILFFIILQTCTWDIFHNKKVFPFCPRSIVTKKIGIAFHLENSIYQVLNGQFGSSNLFHLFLGIYFQVGLFRRRWETHLWPSAWWDIYLMGQKINGKMYFILLPHCWIFQICWAITMKKWHKILQKSKFISK